MSDLREVSLVKGRELHVVRYEKGTESQTLDALRLMVTTSNLDFGWFDAVVLMNQMARMTAGDIRKALIKAE